jgi:[histone H3]-lysine36 N-trimethyltransferase
MGSVNHSFCPTATDCVIDSSTRQNNACGETSDCINRATKMECGDDCTCGSGCQNQRFTRHLFADVSVIQTDKKGYGLRANTNLKPGDFIFEYIGDVIAEAAFRRRMHAYDQEGIKHFYFMSLSKGEFVDATKRGNLGRFCNHSCNPNCYVDKWVIGEKLRMGIFAERHIKAGEELVFNYNVDRYGADPQPCYCGETNCTGFIGGKTQTERGTKLSAATIEALGIEDYIDDWDTVVAKRPKKKKTGEDDEDYVEGVQVRALDAAGVTKVMAALMQCKEKWIAVKLLQRIQTTDDDMVRHRIVRLHGYRILNSQLTAWQDDENILLQILDILDQLPRMTRNKIVDARLDQTLEALETHNDGRVASKALSLTEAYSQLELAYRIPRKKRDDTGTPTKAEPNLFERREAVQQRKRSRSRSKSPPRGPSAISAPSGPRAQRTGAFGPRPPPFSRGPPPLPRGWFIAQDKGRTYYYSASGQTSWTRPMQPADQPPPLPKQPSGQDVLKSIIDNIVTAKDKETKPAADEENKKEKREDKWKSYDEDKQKKLYENTVSQPSIYGDTN